MPEPTPRILSETPLSKLRGATFELAVLPWGATEAHNLHLPCGTDIVETEAIASASARIASEAGAHVLVLPIVPFGVNTGQMGIPGTINMRPSTQMAVLEDVLESLERLKIPKLVILNGHGGNDFKPLIREASLDHPAFVCQVDWWRALDMHRFFDEPGDHAGEMETSLMQYLSPDLVRPLSEAGSGAERRLKLRGFREGWAWTPRDWQRATDDTGTGDPHRATPEKGQRLFAEVTAVIGAFLAELAATPADQLYA
jgi:creatinine amidohydrolase